MKNVLIAMGVMIVVMVGGSGLISMVLTAILGGGGEQSFIYPIYGGLVVLTGFVVGVASVIIDEIRQLRKELEDSKK